MILEVISNFEFLPLYCEGGRVTSEHPLVRELNLVLGKQIHPVTARVTKKGTIAFMNNSINEGVLFDGGELFYEWIPPAAAPIAKTVPATAPASTSKPKPITPELEPTFNATLDTERRYCSVDLLRHVADTHLLKKLSQQIAASAHLPVNTVFMAGLAVFGSMVARKYAVLYPNGEKLPIGIYAVLEQPSGTGKTRCFSIYLMPFQKVQKIAIVEVDKKIKHLKSRKEAVENLTIQEIEELKELTDSAKRLKTGLTVSNATPEGLETTLKNSNGFFSAISSEQGLFGSLLGGSYKPEASSNNNDIVLNGFDAGFVSSVRVSRDGYIGHVVGGIACFAQQGSIETVLKASNGTGLSERFLMLAESHMLGARDHTKPSLVGKTLIDDYDKACGFIEGILDKPRTFDELSNLVISDSGFLKINKYRNQIEPHLADGGRFSHVSLRGAASKINMQIMKVAAILHLLDNGQHQMDIDDRHVDSAIGIANELLEANVKLCQDKGILGLKAEFTAILTLFEKDQRPRTERNIIQVKVKQNPFSEFTGNKSNLIRETLQEMVSQKLLILEIDEGKPFYSLAQ